MSFQVLEHPADLRVRLEGKDLEGLLSSGAQALSRFFVGGAEVSRKRTKTLSGSYLDSEELLVAVLNDLIFEASVSRLVLPWLVDIHLNDGVYQIRAQGAWVDGESLVWEGEVKAATYGGLEVKQLASGGVQADVIFDC
jgi:SHS2 domain-containing protein